MGLLNRFAGDRKKEAGVDEAGRGCYAGPVVAAAVILPPGFHDARINDSKKIAEPLREELREIIERSALAFAVAFVEPEEIDRINILNATFRAMHRSLDALAIRPGRLLIDGNRFPPYGRTEHHCLVKGDGRYLAIAAASILAKTHRDAYMKKIHQDHPRYGWDRNKGYGTADHRKAIQEHGLCEHHRRSFRILPDSPVLFS